MLDTSGVISPDKLLVAILDGQSNQVGYYATRDNAVDTDYAGIYQYGDGTSLQATPSISSSIVPLYHNDTQMQLGQPGNTGSTSWLSPGEYMAREAIESGYADKVLLVPTARGSTHMVSQTAPSWYPAASGGGSLFEEMISQANAAIAAAAVHPDFAGMDIEVVFSWVHGEQDANDGVSQATYASVMATQIAQSRTRVTGASGAKYVIGSMLPNYWLASGTNYDPAMDLINRAHVQASLENANTFYAMGADGNVTGNNGRHYGTAANVREQGRRMTRIFAEPAAAGPTITSADTVDATNGSPFSLALTHDGIHATFAIVGGADAALFDISDPYYQPKLRWVGDGNGPASDGDYVVQVAAYDGGHVQGPVQTITTTVTTAAAPTSVSYVPAASLPFSGTAASGVANSISFTAEIAAGVNLLAIVVDNRRVTGVTVGGNAATLVVEDISNTQYGTHLYIYISASAGSQTVVITVNSSGADIACHIRQLVGANAAASSTAKKTIGSVSDPVTTTSALTVPANGLGVAIARAFGTSAISWNNGTFIDDIAAPVTQRTTGTIQVSIADFAPGSIAPSVNRAPDSQEVIAAAAFSLCE
ncbi:hypothetical protein GRI58_07520 [Porphyrobacter algicida]|uniref:Sialate O-acetylesterase domain-containing protein n=1 Tax=Qipengyuania algicida TaxID=1836209 RepID=A0A845AGS6_9SPHN|nr:sialate O-acetylesterase [Qipengyuania algicida]MXP28667.1 hypothetical protein [Qipengyuania algicida]